ncbi:MAG: ABC transporter permease [Gammaproteobacteria bacterium]|nr:ABC transporter permease [Gammaproteobacteria bacterium]
MINQFSLKVGVRYLFTGASGFSKLVNTVSVVGLALGIILLIVVSSVHNGLADERRNMLLRVVPHAFLTAGADSSLRIEAIRAMDEVTSIRREFRGMAIVAGRAAAPVVLDLIGVDLAIGSVVPADFVEGSTFNETMQHGIALPQYLANRLGHRLGDAIDLTFVVPTPSGLTSTSASFQLTGLFKFVTEVDAITAFVGLAALQERRLLSTGKVGWNISVAEPFEVEALLADQPDVSTWIDTHGEAFRAYQLERTVMYLLMTLVLMLASFNIIAGQAMLINVKRADIAILATLGASRRQLLSAFAIQGGVITAVGIGVGLVLGLTIANNINVIFDTIDGALGIAILEQTAFTELPARVALFDVVGAVLIALVLGGFALVKPLRLALLESPAYVLNRLS